MKWFEGPIPEAINVSKAKGSLFLVYIFGTDEMSTEMDATWNNSEVEQFCVTNDVVAIRMASTSEDCKFFSQIYPVVVVPSTFCIGEGGVPLEVIGGNVSPEDFVTKLQKAQQSFKKQNSASAAPPQMTNDVMETGSLGESTPEGATGGETDKVALKEKLAKASELVEKNRIEKAKREFEKNREEEIKRRKLGQNLHNLKQFQQEQEMKETRDKLKKDKEEDKKAKEKIRAQIAKDREERQERFQKEKKERDTEQDDKKRSKLLEQQQKAALDEAQKSETARIQVRLPDGSSVTHSFPSTGTLQTLHDFITQRTGGSVSISTTFPKRRFTPEDMSSTFANLQLAPSAVVIALPVGQAGRQASSSSVSAGSIFSLLLSPFMLLWRFLYTLVYGGGSNSDGTASQQASSQPGTQNTRSNRPSTATQRRRPDGNVRRMTDMKDDDDDRTTYNGNSTQQM